MVNSVGKMLATSTLTVTLLFSSVASLSPFIESYNIRLTNSLEERECGVIPKIKSRLDNHIFSQFGKAPWQAGIFDASDGNFLCSGTLISSSHVVTAAVCLLAINSPSSVEIRLGDWDISSQDSPFETYDHFSTSVKKVNIADSLVSDSQLKPTIAVLKLLNHVDFMSYPHIAPLCLPSPVSLPASTPTQPSHLHLHKLEKNSFEICAATGWGVQHTVMSTIDKNNLDNLASTNNDVRSSLKSDHEMYLTPVLTGSKLFSLTSNPEVTDNIQKPLHYETTIIIPKVFADSAGESEILARADSQRVPINKGYVAQSVQTIQQGVEGNVKFLDPVEEYIDLPEYVGEDDVHLSEDDYDEDKEGKSAIETTTTTHRKVSLNNMPKGEESMEVMESQKHAVYVAFTTERSNHETTPNVPEPTVKTSTQHESLYRHKQKYKMGHLAYKIQRRESPYQSSSFKTNSDRLVRTKREFPNDIFDVFTKNAVDIDAESNVQMNITSVLKSVQVTFKRKCKHMKDNFPEIIEISDFQEGRMNEKTKEPETKTCIRPKNEAQVSNFCMLDIGSPIVCSSPFEASHIDKSKDTQGGRVRRSSRNIFKNIHHISRHVFPSLDNLGSPNLELVETKDYYNNEKKKVYLAGIITWKEYCQEGSDPRLNYRSTEVVNIQEFLPFLLQRIME